MLFRSSPYILLFGLLVLYHGMNGRRRNRCFPPGPSGLPILGNVLNRPQSHEWLTYQEWSRKYSMYRLTLSCFISDVHRDSDVVHFKLFRTHVIVINSAIAATELFEKRSTMYSDRYVPGAWSQFRDVSQQ